MTKPLLFTDINGVLLNGARVTTPIPGRDELLKTMFTHYDVVSWTSAVKYKHRQGKKIPHGVSRVKHAFQSYRSQLHKELYADSCFDTGDLIWCEGYTKPKLVKSLSNLQKTTDATFVDEAPWVIMIDNDAYKIEDNEKVVRVICDLEECDSKAGLMKRLSELLQKLAEGRLTIDSKQWNLTEEPEPPAKRMKLVDSV